MSEETPLKPYEVKGRDRFAWWLATIALNTFASKQYRAFLSVLHERGKRSLDRYLEIGVDRD